MLRQLYRMLEFRYLKGELHMIDIFVDLLMGSRILCDKERRLGRRSVSEIKEHPFFHDVDWTRLHQREPLI